MNTELGKALLKLFFYGIIFLIACYILALIHKEYYKWMFEDFIK